MEALGDLDAVTARQKQEREEEEAVARKKVFLYIMKLHWSYSIAV